MALLWSPCPTRAILCPLHPRSHSDVGVKLHNPSNRPYDQQVKQIMEEAVTRKFVHEDSSHIISFCGECLGEQGEALQSK